MHRRSGFTLIELLITIVVVGILAGIALPSYTRYITRSKIQEATSNLASSRVKMEQFFQDNRAYTANCVIAPTVPTAGTQIQLPAGQYFTFSCQPVVNPNTTYIIRADGIVGSSLDGLRLEINEANQHWTRTAPSSWGVTGLPKQCWVVKQNGDC